MTEIGVQLPEIGVQLRPKPVFNFARNRCSTSSEKPNPRVCGEAAITDSNTDLKKGPSPRVRGSRSSRRASRIEYGSIPACAGKPRKHRAGIIHVEVHPRVCGEAAVSTCDRAAYQGPSPRVRGSHSRLHARSDGQGSIPACAGKPRRRPARWASSRVHPRACGAAALVWPVKPANHGLSYSAGRTGLAQGTPDTVAPRVARATAHPRRCGPGGSLLDCPGSLAGTSPCAGLASRIPG